MADVNGGALSFTSVMDNEKMNAAIEETLRRVQGFSDAVVGSGDAMDKTTQEIVESINIQKRVINELDKFDVRQNQLWFYLAHQNCSHLYIL